MNTLLELIDTALALPPGPPPTRIWLGLSGGMDSVLLLYGLGQWRQQNPSTEVCALHVNHQLHPEADQWQAHCQQLCQTLNVPFYVEMVVVENLGKGLEHDAREARYGAFRRHVMTDELLVLAHHRDDQVETFLQRAVRGSGPLGLGAMAMTNNVKGLSIVRPLLETDRSLLAEWSRALGLRWVEDPSNADLRLERNYIRHQLLPVWRKFKPDLNQTLSRSARLCAESAKLLAQLAAIDLGQNRADHGLACATLEQLALERQRNLVRHWLSWLGVNPPSEIILQRILQEVVPAAVDAQPQVDWGEWSLRRYQGVLYLLPQGLDHQEHSSTEIPLQCNPLVLSLPWGCLRIENSVNGDAPAATRFSKRRLAAAPLTLRYRQGGERVRPPGRDRKPLKDWFQAHAVPPWLRPHWPILYCGDDIAGIPGLLINAEFEPETTDDAIIIQWHWALITSN